MENKDDKNYQVLVIHGEEYKTLLTTKYINRKKWVNPDERQIFSYIPGTIKHLYVKENATVKKGEPLLILVAMKMENTIFAPFDGKIKSILIKIDDRIPKGQLMMEFE